MTNAANVRVAVTGAVYADITGAAPAPTATDSALNALLKELGFISEDGVKLALPGAGDTEAIHVWQNGATVRTVRTPSDDNPQLKFTMVETKLEVIEFALGVTVTQTATEGSFEFDVTDPSAPSRLNLDVVDGAELIRVFGPRAVVAELEEIELTHTSAIGYGVTLDLERDPVLGYNFKSFMTALKT